MSSYQHLRSSNGKFGKRMENEAKICVLYHIARGHQTSDGKSQRLVSNLFCNLRTLLYSYVAFCSLQRISVIECAG